MGCSDNSPRTFVLKLKRKCGNCGGCLDRAGHLVKYIEGVNSIKVDRVEGKATISGNVDPQTVIGDLRNKKIDAELLGEENCTNEKDNQELETFLFLWLKLIFIFMVKILSDLVIKPVAGRIAKTIRFYCYQKHHHEFEQKCYNKPFACDGCKEEGFGRRYKCKLCEYELHEECRSPEHPITHKFFKRSTFLFRQTTGHNCNCNACGREILGHSYHCEVDNLYLHPRCSKLTECLDIGGTEFELRKKVKEKCFLCKKTPTSWSNKVEGWSYVSKCNNKIYLHV